VHVVLHRLSTGLCTVVGDEMVAFLPFSTSARGHRDAMTRFGYTLMCEQAGPKQLVRDAVEAERSGFDFAVISDHYFPWLDEQGHSAYAWSVLGAVAQATERMRLMTYVTCPTFRYHPAVIAQKAATIALLSDGRFTLGLGAGERLNEHIVGGGWPSVDERHEMLVEAVEIISELFLGGYVTRRGAHFDVDSAKLWDLPPEPVPIGIAVSGKQSCRIAGELADVCIAVEPKAELIQMFEAAGGAGKPKVGQVPISYDPDRDTAVKRAHEQFRWFGLTWKVNSELPGTAGFAAASQFVTREDVAESIPCGPDVDAHVKAIQAYVDAGYTDVALVQVGADAQAPFLDWYSRELAPAIAGLQRR
jgi:G6PDH family F420-dependent oxidoreductase